MLTSSLGIPKAGWPRFICSHDVARRGIRAQRVTRALDIAGALALLLVLFPLIAIIALITKLDSPGPAFFGHRRLGRDGRQFQCFKFRTMRSGAEEELWLDPALRDEYERSGFKVLAFRDPRVTRLGAFLRRNSLDELPQLWNVLRGDMSLVGPRPIVAEEARHYGPLLATLLSVRPGITGQWAVSGRSLIGYPARVAMEIDYVRGRSLRRDLVILLRTPRVVLMQDGAV